MRPLKSMLSCVNGDCKMIGRTSKEEFALFLESPDRTKFRNLLKGNTGEYPHIDFKKKWLDNPILAKHILAMANSSGGVLVIGVGEEEDGSMTPVGLRAFKDKTDIIKGISKFLPEELEFEIINFGYDDSAEWKTIKDKKFQVVIINDTPQYLPFLSLRSSGDTIFKNRVYTRRKTNSEEATHEELKAIINRRLDTNISTTVEDSFKEHLNQLKMLFNFIKKYHSISPIWTHTISAALATGIFASQQTENPNYPEEDFEEFIIKMIKKKKEIIESRIMF